MEPPKDIPQGPESQVPEPTPRELASSWLDYRGGKLRTEYDHATSSLSFHRGYKPTPIGSKPSWIEPGGMDEADWETERLSSAQYKDEQEEIIDELELRIDDLGHDLDELEDNKKLVEGGDEQVIKELAGLEKERRAKIEEAARKKREEQEALTRTSNAEIVPNPDNVQAILRWIKLKGGWGSGDPIEKYAEFAPEGVSEADLQAAFLGMRPLGIANENYDTRGYYLTALADKILRDGFSAKYPNGATEEETRRYWDEEAIITLYRPKTDKYDKFRSLGTYWTRGTLVLNGDFDRDEGIGYGMRGGKLIVKGNAHGVGTFMEGGVLEIEGRGSKSEYWKGKGKIAILSKTLPDYYPPKVRKSLSDTVGGQIDSLVPSDFARPSTEMEGAVDIENSLKRVMNLAKEGMIHSGVPVEKPKGWFMVNKNLGQVGGSLWLVYYDGTEYSHRVPTVRMEVGMGKDGGIHLTVRDWRKAEKVEGHPYNKHGKARKGKYYSTILKDGKANDYKAGGVIDSSHEFPSEEILATRDGFQQAQMYALRDVVKEASEGIQNSWASD